MIPALNRVRPFVVAVISVSMPAAPCPFAARHRPLRRLPNRSADRLPQQLREPLRSVLTSVVDFVQEIGREVVTGRDARHDAPESSGRLTENEPRNRPLTQAFVPPISRRANPKHLKGGTVRDKTYIGLFRTFPDGRWNVTFPDLPGCSAKGGSFKEALENSRRALADHLLTLDVAPRPRSTAELMIDAQRDWLLARKFVDSVMHPVEAEDDGLAPLDIVAAKSGGRHQPGGVPLG